MIAFIIFIHFKTHNPFHTLFPAPVDRHVPDSSTVQVLWAFITPVHRKIDREKSDVLESQLDICIFNFYNNFKEEMLPFGCHFSICQLLYNNNSKISY